MKLGPLFFEQLNKENFLPRISFKKRIREYQSFSYLQNDLLSLPTVNKRKGYILLLIFGLFFLFLIGRLFWLQEIVGWQNRFLSNSNRVFDQANPSPRGVIYDYRGQILAKNTPGFRLVLNPLIFPKEPEVRQKEKDLLLKNIALSKDDFEKKIKQAENFLGTVMIKNNLSYEEQLRLVALKDELKGIEVKEDIVRDYPFGGVLSFVLGYLGEGSDGALVGWSGVEEVYQDFLKGREEHIFYQVDALGRQIKELKREGATPGKNLYLSLDKDLQLQAFDILQKAVKKQQANGAVFVAQEPFSGRILSLISLPSYDNNAFVKSNLRKEAQQFLTDSKKPLFNRAISGLYPPGSIVKPAIGAGALEEKVITKNTKISDLPQIIEIGSYRFSDWRVVWGKGAYGLLDIKEALAQSSDIFFYKIGGGYEKIKGLGVDKIKAVLKTFGLGEKTGIDLPGEVAGLVPDPAWKKETQNEDWYLGNTYHLSIGQGDLLATPLQIVNFMSAIANNGKLYKPQLAVKIADESGKVIKEFKPEIVKDYLASNENLGVIRDGLRLAVENGIVYPLRYNKVAVAAKTGTAEFGVPNSLGVYQTHAWVTGFAPYDNPKISFVVLLEAGGASSNAAEVANEILNWYFSR